MRAAAERRTWPILLATVFAGLLLAAGAIQLLIRQSVSAAAGDAERLFGRGRLPALVRMVECGACPLRSRDRAVWALGELGDARALPSLRAHLTGRKCDHERGLCQYELEKAIRKIEGTWGVAQKIRLSRRPAPGRPASGGAAAVP